jgi:hypothetical protein
LKGTYALGKKGTPLLFRPRQIPDAFHADKELALKIKQLVKVREEIMDGILVDLVAL